MRTSHRHATARALAAGLSLVALAGALACAPSGPRGPDPTVSPLPSAGAPAAERAAALAARLTNYELIGQVLMPSIGLSADTPGAVDAIEEFQLGGAILMGDVRDTGAGGTAAEVRALTDALQEAGPTLSGQRLPLLLATDQEYGWVTRIRSGVVQLPSAMAFGAAGQPELTEDAWFAAGQDLAAVGINVDFAPVADVIGTAGNTTIGSRSFGAQADVVSLQVAAGVRGLQRAGVAATIKHFPGHGNTPDDSHVVLPVLRQSRQELAATDLAPFVAGIQAGAPIVMAGHLDVTAIDPGTPATFSSKVLVDLLRGELGFTGVVVSDALNMPAARRWSTGEAAIRALLAGNDLLLMPPSLAEAQMGLLEALASGRLPKERLVQSVTRILTLKYTLATRSRPDISTVDSVESRAAASAVAAAAVTVLSGPCSGPLVTGPVRITTSEGRDAQAGWLAEELAAVGVAASSGGARVHLVGYGDKAADLAAGAAVTVTMDTPYLLAAADSPVKVATYSSTRASMRALAAVLAGTAPAPGRSPVPVSGLPASACAGG